MTAINAITKLQIAGTDRKTDHIGSIKINRRVNAVGTVEFFLDNTDDTYDSGLSVEHDLVEIAVAGNTIFDGHLSRITDVIRVGKQSRWMKIKKISAADQAEELTFYDDFEKVYPAGWTIDELMDDVFNNAGLTFYHLTYQAGQAGATVLGAFEKKKGQSLLAFLQEVHRSIDAIFIVDNSGIIRSYALANLPDSEITLERANLIGDLEFLRQDASKLYNWVEITGKNPLFDAYTEFNAASWAGAFTPVDDETVYRVGTASIKTTRTGGTSTPYLELDFTPAGGLFNYTEVNLTKGEVGAWVRYDGADSLPTRAIRVQIYDGANTINYYSGDVGLLNTSQVNRTQAYKEKWSWISAPIGSQPDTNSTVNDHWWPIPAVGDFAWDTVKKLRFAYEQASAGDYPDNFWVDGISLPIAPIARSIKTGYPPWGTATHKRPLIATRADLRTQVALQRAADTLLAQSQDATLESMNGLFKGQPALLYGGYRYAATFSALSLSATPFYAAELVHIIAPRQDAGAGHSFTTYVNGVYINARAWDHGRLGPAPASIYSVPGIGLSEK